MALENTSEGDINLKIMEEKDTSNTNCNDETTEQHMMAPSGICDICAEFYNFLVSGNVHKPHCVD